MVWRSVATWQLVQPADFVSASSTDWRAGAGGARRSPESPSAGTRSMAASRGGRNRALMSEGEQQVGEDRILGPALALVVELLQAFSRKKRRGRGIQDHVLAHEGPPLHADRNIPADFARRRRLVAQHAQDLGALELQIRNIADQAPLRRQIEIGSRAEEREARVHEIRLALVLGGAQAREHAVPSRQRHAPAADE